MPSRETSGRTPVNRVLCLQPRCRLAAPLSAASMILTCRRFQIAEPSAAALIAAILPPSGSSNCSRTALNSSASPKPRHTEANAAQLEKESKAHSAVVAALEELHKELSDLAEAARRVDQEALLVAA